MANLYNLDNKFIVTDGGDVMINNTIAGYPNGEGLTVKSSNNICRVVLQNSVSGGSVNDGFRVGLIGSNVEFENTESGEFQFYTGGGAAKMIIDSSGNATFAGNVLVGSGTIDNPQGWGKVLQVQNSGSNGASLSVKDSNNEWNLATYNGVFNISDGVEERLIIDSSGNSTFAGDVVANGTIQTLASNANLTISGDTSGNVYYNNTAGEHRWKANGSSVNSMTLSSSLLTVNENATFTGAITAGGAITATGITTTGSATFGSPLTIKSASPYIKWENAAGTRLAYIQHNETDLVIEADTGIIMLDANTQINGTLGVSSNINTSGLLTATAIDTNAYLSNGTAADLHGRYLGQAIYGSGTGSGDNYGTVADVLRYKDIAIWRKNSSTNVWSNPSDGDALVNGNYAHSWGGYNMDSAYSEYVFYFSNTLGYSFISQTIIQHSTNGNSFNLYIERASSTTNPYDTTGWTTMVTQTGIASWPGITCNQTNWEVGGGYPGLMRIRIVPTWNNANFINIGSFQGYGSYGNFSHAWTTLFDRSVNFQSKIGVGTNPSRALDVTQEALIQGAGNVNMGTLALGPRASGVGKWSTISGAHYNQSSGGGNGSGAAGIMMIGTYGANGENDVYIGGGLYEVNAATSIKFYTHTTDTSTAGGSPRMNIIANGNVGIGVTGPSSKFQVEGAPANGVYLSYLYNSATHNSANGLNVQTSSNNILTYGLRVNTAGDSNALAVMGNGSVGIGTGSPTYKLHVASSNNVSIFEDTSNASGAAFIVFNRPSVFSMGSITRNGSANSVSYNTGSDYRLKEDLKDFNALDLVNNITAYDYKWKDVEQRDYGFIAHELKQTLPNVVTGEKDGEKMQGVDYSKLTPILLKAIQELKAEIELLKSK